MRETLKLKDGTRRKWRPSYASVMGCLRRQRCPLGLNFKPTKHLNYSNADERAEDLYFGRQYRL